MIVGRRLLRPSGGICTYTTSTTHLIWDQSVEAAGTALNLYPAPVGYLDTRQAGGH